MSDAGKPGIVVTGAAGWLGSNLVESLVNGFRDGPDLPEILAGTNVHAGAFASDALRLDTYGDRVKWVTADVRDMEDLRPLLGRINGGIVIHCAGLIHPRRIKELYDINVGGTLNVLRTAASNGASRLVILSSNSPTGASKKTDTVFDEDSPYNPYMNYGRSKMLMELRARELAEELGIELVIVRAPWFYGPKQPARQATFFSMIRKGSAPVVGTGENMRSMAYVDNLSQGLMLAATNPASSGNTYWIADERPYTWNEIINTIESLLNDEFDLPCKGGRMRLPKFVGTTARVADALIQRAGFYNQKIHVLSEVGLTIACDISRAKNELGYRPRIDLREGMRRSIQSALESGVAI